MVYCLSQRKNKAFLKINCTNLNDNLLESELFGHKRGAFTGAFFDKLRLIEEANQGTFFFDEIRDIGPGFQAKLLSVIEDKEIRRVAKKIQRIDKRSIFAANKELFGSIMKAKSKEDLFYKSNILTVSIAPFLVRIEVKSN